MKTKLVLLYLAIFAFSSSCQSDYFELQNDETLSKSNENIVEACKTATLAPNSYNDIEYSMPNEIKDSTIKTGWVKWDKYPDPTPINSYEDFSIDDYYDPSLFRVDIFVSSAKDEGVPLEDPSRAYVTSRTNQTATVFFASPGIFNVCFYVYSKTTGNCVAQYISEQIIVQA